MDSVEPGWLKIKIDTDKFPGIENIYNNKSRSGIFQDSCYCLIYELNKGDI